MQEATGPRRLAKARRRYPRLSAGVLLSAPMALLLFTAACGGSDDGGDSGGSPTTAASGSADALGAVNKATGAPVKIGIVSDGKTPALDNTVQFEVAEATVKWLNEHRGGLGGRPIEIVKCDTQGDPAKGTDCGNQLVEQDVVAVAVGESSVGDAVAKPLADADIPAMFYGLTTPDILKDPTIYSVSDPNFAIQQLPIASAQQAKAKKVVSVVIDVPAILPSVQDVAPGLMKAAGLDYQLIRIPPGTADMTAQLQAATTGGPSVAFVIGNDAFCISAFNGLRQVGFDGPISAISQCMTDATRKAVSGSILKGMTVAAAFPVGGDDPSTALYNSVISTYGKNIDPSATVGRGMFVTLAGLMTATDGVKGDITPATVNAAIKAMPEKELPGAGGLRFRCNGKAYPESPSVCTRGGLTTTLDDKGEPTGFKVQANTPIPD
ncbi:branched-chain amino acid ABC transporter substrate-binding protein [Pseudofrankia asymbiotica]|uniref:Branched-chain amino acid ABC transporter substrate-binding protein n=2 Tax=Pseudofrankia asymbiotica TaxID=1834516 RepID=A0A1V2I690_9ACTN|nr:branched-chain amino acid ABC transporter substrate-binding protein [Pseudofrankia asymbiotica]